ncbi:MAG: hypothetical protein QG654_132, partial [Patescibacteria group bacterium]|nr:hypothetical protein [Patescibacteria group bacterium]
FLSGSSSASGQYSTQTGQFTGTITPVIEKTGTIFAVFTLMVIVNGFLMWTFVSVALLFVGRVIGLWFSMIFSPIAFITLAVPGSGGFVKQMSFDTWKDTVLKLAFMAPIFIFFLYLMISFLSIFGTGPAVPAEGADIFTNLMKIFIPFIFIIVLLQIAKKTADSMAGEFGGMVKGIVGKVAGVVASNALGATAFAGRAVGGRIASAALSSGNYNAKIADAAQKAKDATNPAEKALALANLKRLESTKAMYEKAKNSTWDIRNAGQAKGVVGWASRQAGRGLGAGMTGFGGAGFNAGAGDTQSRASYEKEKEEEKIKKAGEIEQVGRNEFSPTIARMMKRGDSNDKVTAHIDKTLSQIDKDIAKAGAGSELGKKKQAEKDKILDLRGGVVAAGTDKTKAKAAFESKTGKWSGVEAEKKEEMTRRRNMYADRVDEDAWYSATTGENEYTADKIRRGTKVKSDSEKQADEIAKAVKEALKQQPPPPPGTGPSPGTGNPPQPPPPPPPPPPGTGPTRGPGGGSAGAGTI